MEKNKYFKCPRCGCSSYTEYDNQVRNGIIGAAVGAVLLGPVGLLGAGFGMGSNSTGKKCTQCGKKVPNELSAAEKQGRANAGKAFAGIAQKQFKEGYQRGYSDDD